MEHYRKTSSQYVSEVKLSNELKISSAGKPYDLATRALHTLHVRLLLLLLSLFYNYPVHVCAAFGSIGLPACICIYVAKNRLFGVLPIENLC